MSPVNLAPGTLPRSVNHFRSDRVSDTFRVQICGVPVRVAVCPDMSETDCEKLSDYYNGMHHPNMRLAPRHMTYHVVHADVASLAGCNVCVQVREPISKFAIYPLRKEIHGRADGNALRFTLKPNAPYLIVEIDSLPMLYLIVEMTAEDDRPTASRDTVNFNAYARRFATDGDHTVAFQHAIADINGTGRTLYVPPSEYRTQSILLHHCCDCSLYFDEGALVNMAISPPGENIKAPGIWLHECENVTIRGRGYLDQRSYENFHGGRNDYAHGFRDIADYQTLQPLMPDDPLLMSPLLITNSRHVRVHDITLRNGKVWNINVKNSRHLHFSRCKVITPPASNPEWTDGFNFGGCRDVRIDDCFVAVNDDCFAAAHYVTPYDRDNADGFTVRGLVGFNPRAQGIRLGWACHSAQGTYSFEDCDFIGKCEILVHPLQDAGARRLRYEELRFVDCGFDMFPDIGIEHVAINRLEFTNVTFNSPFTRGRGRIVGDPQEPITHLLWRNNRVAGTGNRLADCLYTEHIAQFTDE